MTDMKGTTSTGTDLHILHKEWDDIACPICMDHPHNAVLLICSSHDKGCRSYICDTSYRHSNCLDRFKKLRLNNAENSSQHSSSSIEISDSERQSLIHHHSESSESFTDVTLRRRTQLEIHEGSSLEENINVLTAGSSDALEESHSQEHEIVSEVQGEERMNPAESVEESPVKPNCLKCPLCRGIVMGWMIVKEAREYLDLKARSCSRESCSFSGNYRELRRHARRVHPTTRPADVDPTRQRAWRRLEHQREYGDILSAIRSAMPGAIVLGDYVIDSPDSLSRERINNGSGEGSGPWWTTFFLFHMISSPTSANEEPRGSSRAWRTHRRRNLWGENLLGLQDDVGDENFDHDDNPIPRRRRRFMRSRPDEEQP